MWAVNLTPCQLGNRSKLSKSGRTPVVSSGPALNPCLLGSLLRSGGDHGGIPSTLGTGQGSRDLTGPKTGVLSSWMWPRVAGAARSLAGGAEAGDTDEGVSGSQLRAKLSSGLSPDTSEVVASLESHLEPSGRGFRMEAQVVPRRWPSQMPWGSAPPPSSGCLLGLSSQGLSLGLHICKHG